MFFEYSRFLYRFIVDNWQQIVEDINIKVKPSNLQTKVKKMEKQYLVVAEFTDGQELELYTNVYRRAFSQYETWTKDKRLDNVRMIDMHSDRIGDMFSYTKR